ncbi:hypothetical protein GQ44DRAFT_807457 [Phaeosphaeriaceae sp. PMI808]|nr:hypothetical protein GQ44DRAFT_807457 [Phaeosphaeriaceae sp. PMI808]
MSSPEIEANVALASRQISPPILRKYPGLGLPVHYMENVDSYRAAMESSLKRIYVRELAIMSIMEKLTDKPNWQKKVFDDIIVAKWHEKALAIHNELLFYIAASSKCGRKQAAGDFQWVFFDTCIKELQSKAKYFEETSVIPTLDTSASVTKSDRLVTSDLHNALCAAFDKLKSDHATSPDWRPNSNDMVQDLVYPSMYPLVYGRTRVFQAGCVIIEDAITSWVVKGTVIPEIREKLNSFWPQTHQWLPANLSFQQNGSLRFTSHVNNLHPKKYSEIYRTIEKLAEVSLPLWDQVLGKICYPYRAGRSGPHMGILENTRDDNEEKWIPNYIEEYCGAEITQEGMYEAFWYSDLNEPEDMENYKRKAIRKPMIPGLTSRTLITCLKYAMCPPLLSHAMSEIAIPLITIIPSGSSECPTVSNKPLQ